MAQSDFEFDNCLFVSDLHLRHRDQIWSRRPEISGDGQLAVSQILDFVKKNKVQLLFLGGDITDTASHRSDAISLLRQLLEGADELGARVFFVQGQHEFASPPLLSSIYPLAMHAHEQLFKVGGETCYGLDYAKPNRIRDALLEVPFETDILFTHQVWKEFMGEERGHATVEAGVGFSTVLTGDFHRPAILGDETTEFRFISPGPPHLQRWGESVGGGIWLTKGPQFVPVQFEHRPYADLLVSDLSQLPQTLDEISALVKDAIDSGRLTPLVRITSDIQTMKLVRPELESRFEEEAHLFFNSLTADVGPYETELSPAISEVEAIVAEAEGDQKLADDVLSVLNSNDIFEYSKSLILNPEEEAQ